MRARVARPIVGRMQSVIITGGNTGLGFACAKTIARAGGWHLIIACRNQASGEAAAQRLRAASGPDTTVETLPLDLASQVSIRSFAMTIATGGRPPLRAIVCNAGIQVVSATTYTTDGVETTFGVNHLGHFLLVHLLASHLEAPARIVVVSSGTHDADKRTGMPAPVFTDVASLARPSVTDEDVGVVGRRAYSTSKLCNVMFTYELARRLHDRGVTVNAFDPGLMPGSGLARDYSWLQRFGWHYILPLLTLVMRNVNTTRRSGRRLATLVLDPAMNGITGRYFEGSREIASSRESYDPAKTRALWDGSVALAHLAPGESIGEPTAPRPMPAPVARDELPSVGPS